MHLEGSNIDSALTTPGPGLCCRHRVRDICGQTRVQSVARRAYTYVCATRHVRVRVLLRQTIAWRPLRAQFLRVRFCGHVPFIDINGGASNTNARPQGIRLRASAPRGGISRTARVGGGIVRGRLKLPLEQVPAPSAESAVRMRFGIRFSPPLRCMGCTWLRMTREGRESEGGGRRFGVYAHGQIRP